MKEIRIDIVSFEYVGNKPFKYKASNHKTYNLEKGDILSLKDDHFARLLRHKSFFKEVENKKITPKKPKVKESQNNASTQSTEGLL
ncbi:hypothetical protein LS70_003915 [Helicobacter sp. MIT 11-5569]|uniref:hypothetical protein n=1 Tax=Helicobacter sp. MIT 11-5569 TaxID=1548151 RepID=UPI00051FC402|nr:hypothetical protein [Helicobacter sp. MIT 11-5569]TLD83963.1 hypothetical protein LS70_003915 [Helicobacter sp. MIT 11-5569]